MKTLKSSMVNYIVLNKSKLKTDIKTSFLGGVESIWPCMEAVRAFFCHVRRLKQKEQASASSFLFFITNLKINIAIYIIINTLFRTMTIAIVTLLFVMLFAMLF